MATYDLVVEVGRAPTLPHRRSSRQVERTYHLEFACCVVLHCHSSMLGIILRGTFGPRGGGRLWPVVAQGISFHWLAVAAFLLQPNQLMVTLG